MLKWLDSPRHLFAILRVIAVLAIVAGVWLSLICGVVQVIGGETELTAAALWYVISALANGAMWSVAWGSFIGMCTRLMRGGTAFTKVNSRTLQVIGGCVGMMALVMCVRALPRLIAGPDAFLVIEAIILPGTFLTVAGLAFILSRLLDHAMALEAEQADVV